MRHRSTKILAGPTIFENKLTEMIRQETDPTNDFLVYQNLDSITAKGLEAQVERRLMAGLSGKISYTYTRTRDNTTNEEIVNSPRHMVKCNLSIPVLADQVFIGVETQYTSSRKMQNGQAVSSYIITNLTIFSQELLKGLELSGSIYNLFDKTYTDPGGIEHTQNMIEQDGRLFRIKLAYRY